MEGVEEDEIAGAEVHLGRPFKRGTRVRFRPDEAIFQGRVTPALVADLITETSWLHPHLCLIWQGEALTNGGGIEAWTRLRASADLADDFVFATRTQDGESAADVALGWLLRAREGDTVRTFVNSQPKPVDALLPGVIDGMRCVAEQYGRRGDPLRLAAGLIDVVHVTVRDDRAPTDTLVARAITGALRASLDDHPEAKKRFPARA